MRLVQLVQSAAWAMRPRCALALVSLLQLGVSGCELPNTLQGIASSLGGGGEKEDVDGEGDELLKGNFYSLRFDGNMPDGIFVVAIELPEDDPETRLMLVPFQNSEAACSPGPAERYGPSRSRPGKEGSRGAALLPFVRRATDDAPRTLKFTNFACEVADVEVPGSSLPINADFPATPGYLAVTEFGELYFVNPWAEEKRLIAEGLAPFSPGEFIAYSNTGEGRWLWTREAGRIVARDTTFRARGTAGKAVDQALLATTSSGTVLIYHETDNTISSAPSSNLRDDTLLETDGCDVRLDVTGKTPRITYYSPCGSGNLTMLDLETRARSSLAEGVVNYRMIGDRTGGPVFMFLTGEDATGSVGTLWARFGEQTPVKLGDRGHLGLTRLTVEGEAKALLDWGDLGGTLSVGEAGKALEPQAENVVFYSALGVIADWDGALGTLYQFDEARNLLPVQERVSTSGVKYDSVTKRGLVLVDYDGWQGELTMIRDHSATPLSKRVRPDSYQFTVQLPTVTILSDLDPDDGTATLKLRMTDGTNETIVSEGVSEVLEVSWPKAGFLYSVPLGERNGIWFTEAE